LVVADKTSKQGVYIFNFLLVTHGFHLKKRVYLLFLFYESSNRMEVMQRLDVTGIQFQRSLFKSKSFSLSYIGHSQSRNESMIP
jgi:hypothetical protein